MPFCSLILCKKGCTRVDPKSDPRVLIWTNLEEVHKMMLHTKYESCLPSGFREEDFWRFSYFHPSCSDELKGMRPGGAQIWPKGLDMNKLGRGPLDDATYQKWKQCALWFRLKKILKDFRSLILCKKGCARVEPKYDPRVLIWTNLVEVH